MKTGVFLTKNASIYLIGFPVITKDKNLTCNHETVSNVKFKLF